jgi:hypothetical protein
MGLSPTPGSGSSKYPALIQKDRKEAARRFRVDPKTKAGNPSGNNQYQREETGTVPNSS